MSDSQSQPIQTQKIQTQIPQTPQPQIQKTAKEVALMAQAPSAPIEEIKIEPKKEEPIAPIQNTPTMQNPIPSHIAQNQDGAQIWMNIVAAIPSLPTRAFFSGVAKLIGVENKKIKLGFLNDNVLAGAKSPAKLPILENAIKGLYPDYTVEFTRIDSSTKIIEVKPKVAPQAPTPRPQMPQVPQTQGTVNTQQNPISNQETNEEENKEQSNEKKHYSPKVREMIDQFNGRIID